ncbi:LysR substrate-binding domain-containing protein [Sagittula salina]|uniref:LysR family transcriptional regulator n=1 Tax=Sagittula salina TaxID=2820268 RepID=A0A940S2X2_9RHOB|nr:LysR substrate-binding domain-containing protein [Sagittula salina]MBP0484532.1 LysR family transcriptional regulator [Sagittula salina]
MTTDPEPSVALRHLRAFLAVVETGGFSAAGQSIRRSTSAVSRSVSLLEGALGRPLLLRGPGRQIPTPAGEAVARRCALIRRELATCRDQVARYHAAAIPPSSALFGMMVDCAHLRALVAVRDFRSVQRAARVLGVTQPAVSYSIRLLEADTGVTQFSRLPTGMVATPAGDSLAITARRVLAELSRMVDDVRSAEGVSTGLVRVGALAYSRTALLPGAIRQVLADHPNVSVCTVEGHIDHLMTALHHGEIDVLLCAYPDRSLLDGISLERIERDRLGFFVRPDHPLAGRRGVALTALLDHDFILPPQGTITRVLLEEFFAENGLRPPRGRAETSSYSLVRELVAGSDCIAFRTRREFPPHPDAAAVALDTAVPAPEREICVLQRLEAHQTAAVGAFLDVVRGMGSLGPDGITHG